MYRLFGKWRGLERGDRWLLLGLMCALPMVEMSITIFGVFRTQRWIEASCSTTNIRAAAPADLLSAQKLARLAEIAGRRGAITATCLRQALVVYALLRRRGFAPEFKIGVRKQNAALDAHAWVELEGIALGDGHSSHSPFNTRDLDSRIANR